jgi:hypothetical protein
VPAQPKAKAKTKVDAPPVADLVAEILQGYATRGVFRGFSRGDALAGKTHFKLLWHRDRLFDLMLDTRKKTLHFPIVLPQIPKDSTMYADFREFLKSRFAKDRPDHRRLDRRKVGLVCALPAGNLSLTMTVIDADYEYATRKLIHLVHEVYLDYLSDGRYYDYMIEVFNLDPDRF